jgi:hypothetical protein
VKSGIKLSNKVNGVSVTTRLIDVQMSPGSSSCSSPDCLSTPKKSGLIRPDTPLKAMLLSNTPYHNNSVEKNKLISSLLDLIVEMNLPISIVDHPAMVRYTSNLNNRFRIPCRQTYTNTIIPQRSKASKDQLRKLLDGVSHCSLTCDGWTSIASNSYLGVTVHFVLDWTLKSYILALKHLEKQHTAENLLAALKEVTTQWGISKKVMTVSADGAYNIKKVIIILMQIMLLNLNYFCFFLNYDI